MEKSFEVIDREFVKVVTHKGKEIVCYDYRMCKNEDQLLYALKKAINYANANPQHRLWVGDFSDVGFSRKFMAEVKQSAKIWDQGKVANLGIEGIKKVLYNAFNKVANNKARAFNSYEEAFDYLAA